MDIQREARLQLIIEENVIATETLSHAREVQNDHGLAGELLGRLKASGATTRQRQINLWKRGYHTPTN